MKTKKYIIHLKIEGDRTTFAWVEDFGLTIVGKDREETIEKTKWAIERLQGKTLD
jgi:hypothetical protein